MREATTNINLVKQKISELLGKDVELQINRGRKKTETYYGKLSDAYPQVFVLTLRERLSCGEKISCSYSDVLCGNVVLQQID